MQLEKFWQLIADNLELPFDIADVSTIESNCGSVWIELKNGTTYYMVADKCEKDD